MTTIPEAERAVIAAAIEWNRDEYVRGGERELAAAVDALLALRSSDAGGEACEGCRGFGSCARCREPVPEQGAPPCACGSVGAYHYPRCLLFREGSTPEGLPPDGTKPADFELPEESGNG